jgi:hypothetical protein
MTAAPTSPRGRAPGASGETLSGLDLSGTTHTSVGSYTDTWTFTDSAGNYNNASGTVTDVIGMADATCKVTSYSVTYDGQAHTAAGSCTGVSGETLTGLDLYGTAHTNAGSYTDKWTFTDPTGNYNDTSGTVTDTISKADPKCTISGYTVTYDGKAHTVGGWCTGVSGEALTGLDLSGTAHASAGSYRAGTEGKPFGEFFSEDPPISEIQTRIDKFRLGLIRRFRPSGRTGRQLR